MVLRKLTYIFVLIFLHYFGAIKFVCAQGEGLPDYIGEKLEYSIFYSFIRAGTASMSFQEDSLSGNYYIKMDSRTVGVANTLYRIRDIYECTMDPLTGYPIKAIRNIREGRYRAYNEVEYDHHIREDSTLVNSQKSGVAVVPKEIYDILSAFYLLRKKCISGSLQQGDTIFIKTYFTDEVFDLNIRYMGKEKVKTEFGKIICHKFNPVTEVGRAFKTEDDMTIWFTDDSNFLPVKVRLELRIGSVRVELVDFSGLKHESQLSLKK